MKKENKPVRVHKEGLVVLIKVEISSMTESDINDILCVETLSFKIPWSKNAFCEELQNTAARYLVAKVNNTSIGYAGMWKVLDEGHITNIAVHPEFRKSGVGGMLLEGLLALAANEGIHSMTLEVRRNNTAAQKLYTKYGFQVEGIRKAYYADNGEDAIIMWKNDI